MQILCRSLVAFAVAMSCAAVAFAIEPKAVAGVTSDLRIGKLPSKRILFLGNSITLHGPAANIGWKGNWGMAATAAEKDYVHLVTSGIAKASGGNPEIIVKNIADFERQHATYDIAAGLKQELAFKADIVIVAIGENVPGLKSDEAKAAYASAFAKLLDALKQQGAPAIVVRGCFWADPTKDRIMQVACEKNGGTFVDISKLDQDEKHFARSEVKFEHAGVAAHPGDRGMQAIADAIFNAIEKRAVAP